MCRDNDDWLKLRGAHLSYSQMAEAADIIPLCTDAC
jgi:hypothetical protein